MRQASNEEIQRRVQAASPELQSLVGPILIKDIRRSGRGSIEIASGLILRVGERLFAITAAHVFEDQRHKQFGLIPKWQSLITEVNWLPGRSVALGGGAEHQPLDVAAFEVAPEEAARWGVVPFPIERVVVYHIKRGEFALLHGFPMALADIEYGGTRVVTRHMTFATVGASSRGVWKPYRRALHQVLAFPKDGVVRVDGAGVVPDELPDPGGISGSGVWVFADGDDVAPERPEMRLAGIQFGWFAPARLAFANTMDPVLRALQEGFPELRATLARAKVVVPTGWEG